MDMKNNRSPTKEDFLKIRGNTGMNRKEFAEYLQIPYRTVQDWELGKRQAPVYVYKLIREKMERDFPKRENGKTSVLAELNKLKERSSDGTRKGIHKAKESDCR